VNLRSFLIACGVLACADAGPGAGDAILRVVSGDGQIGWQRTELPQPIVVEAVRGNGAPLAGMTVTVSALSGSGRIIEAQAVTDEQGRLEFRWELGDAYENRAVVSLTGEESAQTVVGAVARYLYEVPEATGDGWETASLGSVGFTVEPLIRLMDSLRTRHYGEVHSVVIVKDERLVFEEYFSGYDFDYTNPPSFLGAYMDFDRDTRHDTHSATKSVVSALVGIAVDQGLIQDVNRTVFSFFDDYAAYNTGGKDAITIEHLLTMTSGLEWYEWDAPHQSGGNSLDVYLQADDPTGYALSMPLIHEPGTVFNYNGGTVNVLCRIVERVSGKRIDAFADEYLFRPMGVTSYHFPGFITPIFCSGDIYLRPRDMAKFGDLFLNEGDWYGQRLVSEAWVTRSVAPSVSLADWHLSWADDYGYLWWRKAYQVGGRTYSTFKAIGWGGQEITVFPDQDLVVVFTGANYTRESPCDEFLMRFILPALGG
jgi:CubicO group peptidase (beta-lactamase class C family)